MRTLPLYPKKPSLHVLDTYEPIQLMPGACGSCELSAKSVAASCMRPEGDAGGLYVLGDAPSLLDARSSRPFSGEGGKLVRTLVARHWTGPVALDYAVRCAPGGAEIKDKHVEACSHYLAQVLEDVSPTRIVTIGATAASALLGASAHTHANERGFSVLGGVPVFHLPVPILSNKFYRAAFEADLEWALTAEVPSLAQGTYSVIESAADAKAAVAAVREDLVKFGTSSVVYDVETYGRPANDDFRVISAALMAYGGSHTNAPRLFVTSKAAARNPRVMAVIGDLLGSVTVTTTNGKYDAIAMKFNTIHSAKVGETDFDARLIRKLLDPEAAASLEVMGYLVGLGGHKAEADAALSAAKRELKRIASFDPDAKTPSGKPKKQAEPLWELEQKCVDQLRAGVEPDAFAFDFIGEEILLRYNARDVHTLNHLRVRLEGELCADPRLARFWDTAVRRTNAAMTQLEATGFPVNAGAIKLFADYCYSNLALQRDALSKYGTFSPSSPKQVAEFIYDKLRLRNPIKEKPARSTDKEVLEALADAHPAMRTLREYRHFDKLNGNYAAGMIPHVRDNGRIHASYLLDGAQSGRTSCSAPNLQNVPRAKGSPDAKLARSCFVAPPGYTMVEADFSQLELRVAAMLAQDKAMIEDFKAGIDIHAANARACAPVTWKISHAMWDAMSKDERDPFRSKIKSGTFGKLYGKSVYGLAKQLKCSVDEAQQIVDMIWGRYSVLDAWTKAQVREARKTGETWTWWNGERTRRRYIWGIAHPDEGYAAHYERVSYNNPVQGTASEFCLQSVVKLVEGIEVLEFDAQLVGTVHDSIISIVRDAEVAPYAKFKKRTMESFFSAGVPIVADVKIGKNWGELVDYNLEDA